MESVQPPRHARSMRFLAFFLLAMLAVSSFSQESADQQIAQAQRLREQGHFQEASAVIERLIHSLGPDAPSPERLGAAWISLGQIQDETADYDAARRSDETAMRILKNIPSAAREYALAVDNLGAVEADTGQYPEARMLRTKARDLYVEAHSHSGAAWESSGLALVDLEMNHISAARKDMEFSEQETGLARSPDDILSDNDAASIGYVKGLVAMAAHDFRTALDSYQQAIAVLTRQYGADAYQLGAGYSLRAFACEKLGQHQQALADMQHSLAIFEATVGRNSPTYYVNELHYAELLKRSGDKEKSAELEKTARAGLNSFYSQRCNTCTIPQMAAGAAPVSGLLPR